MSQPPPPGLLDTNILSALMKRNPRVTVKARDYLTAHQKLSFSIITRYEILRGLKARGAITRLEAFERLCASSIVLPVEEEHPDGPPL